MVATVLGKGAVGVETVLVLQLSYLMMVDQEQVLEAKSGLQKAGRYTMGYNVAVLDKVYVDSLLAVELDSNLFNVVSVIFCLTVGLFVVVTVLMLC